MCARVLGSMAAAGPALYTSKGEDYESVEYKAIFVNGKIASINQVSYETKPAWPIKKLRLFEPRSEEDKAAEKARENESLIGKKVYVLYGGQEKGYYSTVVAENTKQWCLQKDDGEFELMYRSQRDNLVFDTEDEALSHKNERKAKWDKEAQEYEAFVAERMVDKAK